MTLNEGTMEERIRRASVNINENEAQEPVTTKPTYTSVTKENINHPTGTRPKTKGRYVPISHFETRHPMNNNQAVVKEPTVEELFSEAESIVGFAPISREDITRWAWNSKNVANQDIDHDTDTKVFKSPAYEEERIQAGVDILINKLGFYPNEVEVSKAEYCVKTEKQICWLTTNKYFAKQIFIRAAQVPNPDLDVIQFVPGPAIDRK